MTLGEKVLIILVLIAVPLALIGIPVYLLLGGIRTFALRPLQRCFAGLELHTAPQLGDVSFIYHTYRGFLAWTTQEEHCIHAPPRDAQLLLGRLLRFNLTWGLLSPPFLFVPLLSIGNYYTQKRAIAKQIRSLDNPSLAQSANANGSEQSR